MAQSKDTKEPTTDRLHDARADTHYQAIDGAACGDWTRAG
jgi:hypothetical protein